MTFSIFLLFLIVFTYAIYPVLIAIAGRFLFKKQVVKSKRSCSENPTVAILITGHNIENLIEKKIEGLLKQSYKGQFEIIFVLDGCTDNSKFVVTRAMGKYENIKFHECRERIGKEAAIRSALHIIEADVLAFSDSDSVLEPNALQYLIKKLCENGVGAVSGREVHEKESEVGASQGQGLFYRYEEYIKRSIEKFSSLSYVQGGNFVMWRDLYPKDIPEGCTQDGVIAFDVILSGNRVAYEEKAISSESYDLTNKADFNRRIRTITRAFYSIMCRYYVFKNPFAVGFAPLHIIFTRLLRWFSGIFFVFSLVFGFIFGTPGYVLFLLVVTFVWLILVLVGGLSEHFGIRLSLPYFAYYFSYIHVAAALAVIMVLCGKRTVTWVPTQS